MVLGKVFFLILPYLVSADVYKGFNKVYYTAALAVSISSFGFNIAFAEQKVKLSSILSLVLLNLLPVYLIIFLVNDSLNFFAPLISYLLILEGIFLFFFLFNDEIYLYFLSGLLLFTAQVAALILVSILKTDLIISYSILTAVSTFIILFILKKNYTPTTSVDVKNFYKIGFGAFVINGAAAIAFNADKFVVNNSFSLETANAYTFAWTLIAPAFYIGALIEKGIYSERADKNLINKTKKYTLILLGALVIYFGLLTAAVNFYPKLLPGSLEQKIFTDILYVMTPGFFLFILLHTPVNAVLFKLYRNKIRSKIALFFIPVIFLFLISLFIVTRFDLNNDVLLILSITWLYLFVLQGIKIYLMYSNQKLNFIE